MSVSGAERARLLALIQSSAEQTIAKAKADGTPIIPYGSDVVLESEATNDTQKVENDVMGKRGTKAMEEDSIQKAENGYGNDEIEPESKREEAEIFTRPKSSPAVKRVANVVHSSTQKQELEGQEEVTPENNETPAAATATHSNAQAILPTKDKPQPRPRPRELWKIGVSAVLATNSTTGWVGDDEAARSAMAALSSKPRRALSVKTNSSSDVNRSRKSLFSRIGRSGSSMSMTASTQVRAPQQWI